MNFELFSAKCFQLCIINFVVCYLCQVIDLLWVPNSILPFSVNKQVAVWYLTLPTSFIWKKLFFFLFFFFFSCKLHKFWVYFEFIQISFIIINIILLLLSLLSKILSEVALDVKMGGIDVGKKQWQKTISLSHPFIHYSSSLMSILSFQPNQASIYQHSIPRNLKCSAGMASPTNLARVRFPDPVSDVGWVCWFSTLHWEVFSGNSGFLSPQKPKFDCVNC